MLNDFLWNASKTVTWADDPQMNFKREVETTPTYDSNQTSDYRGVADTGETSQRDSNQQQQQQQQQLYQYENESYATETNAPIQYSVSDDANVDLQPSDGGDQSQNYYYGDGNYGDSTTTTAATAGTAVDPQTGAYYDQSGQQAYQDQYYYEDGQNQPLQQQPQQQQYAPNDGNEQRRYSDAQQVKIEIEFRSQFPKSILNVVSRIRINRIIKISSSTSKMQTPPATHSSSRTQMAINTQIIRSHRVQWSRRTHTTNKAIRTTIKRNRA